MVEKNKDPMNEYLRVNRDVTLNLALAAKKNKIKRFIYISSIKVNGERTEVPFTADDDPHPEDCYGASKWEAEKALMQLHKPGVFEVVIIRPPLIYGLGVKGNFATLIKIVKSYLPLPFGLADQKKRSFVSVFNLCDLILKCTLDARAAGQIFLVSDDHDLSLKELIQKIALATHKKIFLFSFPVGFFYFAARLINKQSYADRLFGALQVNIEKTKATLDWHPPYSFEQTFLEKI